MKPSRRYQIDKFFGGNGKETRVKGPVIKSMGGDVRRASTSHMSLHDVQREDSQKLDESAKDLVTPQQIKKKTIRKLRGANAFDSFIDEPAEWKDPFRSTYQTDYSWRTSDAPNNQSQTIIPKAEPTPVPKTSSLRHRRTESDAIGRRIQNGKLATDMFPTLTIQDIKRMDSESITQQTKKTSEKRVTFPDSSLPEKLVIQEETARDEQTPFNAALTVTNTQQPNLITENPKDDQAMQRGDNATAAVIQEVHEGETGPAPLAEGHVIEVNGGALPRVKSNEFKDSETVEITSELSEQINQTMCCVIYGGCKCGKCKWDRTFRKRPPRLFDKSTYSVDFSQKTPIPSQINRMYIDSSISKFPSLMPYTSTMRVSAKC
jgi:hypothetical protein